MANYVFKKYDIRVIKNTLYDNNTSYPEYLASMYCQYQNQEEEVMSTYTSKMGQKKIDDRFA